MSTLKDHNEMVSNLVKPKEAILSEKKADLCHILHMAFGLVGEAIEVQNHINDHTPEKEYETDYATDLLLELGDVTFYLAGLSQSQGWTLEGLLKEGRDTFFSRDVLLDLDDEAGLIECEAVDLAPRELVRYAGYISEAVKKHWIYGKPLPTELKKWFICVLIMVFELARGQDHTLDAILQMNIEKLEARYKGFDYSDEAALRREDTKRDLAAT